MRSAWTRSALIALSGALILAGEARAEPPVVAVFGIEGKDARVSPKTLDNLTELLSATLGAGASYRIIPQGEVKARLTTTKAESYNACYDQACQIEIGKELAAEKSLSTKILRIGDRCVLTASLFDLRTAVTERTATNEAACTDVALLGGVRSLAADLSKDRSAPGSTAPTGAEPHRGHAPNKLSSWRQQEGADFEERDGGFIGSAGRLAYAEDVADFVLDFDAEHLGGSASPSIGICWRGGGPEGQTPTRAYCAGFQWSGAYNVFVGISGSWRVITKGWTKNQPYKPTTLIHAKKNHYRVEARGPRYELRLNGEVIEAGEDPTFGSGRLYLGTEAGAFVKLSNITLRSL